MRIVAGRFKGTGLASLGKGDPGAHLRPTTDRVRESLFNILTHGSLGDVVTDTRVLDLFAGTGALGLEALSRGAEHVCFVENGRKALALLQENLRLCRAEAETRLLKCDATRLPTGTPAGLVFLDPPYGKGLGTPALEAALAQGWLAAGAVIVWEEAAPQTPPPGFTLVEHRRFGDSHVTFLLAPG